MLRSIRYQLFQTQFYYRIKCRQINSKFTMTVVSLKYYVQLFQYFDCGLYQSNALRQMQELCGREGDHQPIKKQVLIEYYQLHIQHNSYILIAVRQMGHYFKQFPSNAFINQIVLSAGNCRRTQYIYSYSVDKMFRLQYDPSKKTIGLVRAPNRQLGSIGYNQYLSVNCGYTTSTYGKNSPRTLYQCRYLCQACACKFDQKLQQMSTLNWDQLQRVRLKEQKEAEDKRLKQKQQWDRFLQSQRGRQFLLRKQAQQAQKLRLQQENWKKYLQSRSCIQRTKDSCQTCFQDIKYWCKNTRHWSTTKKVVSLLLLGILVGGTVYATLYFTLP